MSSISGILGGILYEILSDHTACIAREINDRACYEYDVPFESFMKLRHRRDELTEWGIIKEIVMGSPYGKPCQFYYLNGANNVNRTIRSKRKLIFEYSEHTGEIGKFGEQLVAEALRKLGFTEISARKRTGKRDVDVLCRDRSGDFYWAIECKNRRQEINVNDVENASDKAKLASSKWNLELVNPAIISSSIYERIPDDPILPIIRTGYVYVPNRDFFHEYKTALGSWYLKSVSEVPDDLVGLIDEGLGEKLVCS